MKTCLMVPVLLALMVVGIHVEQQLDRYHAGVGEEISVMLWLGNTGESALDVSVFPAIPPGLSVQSPGLPSVTLSPGGSTQVAYLVRGEAPGLYPVTSQVTYTDFEGRSRQIVCGDRSGRQLNVS